MSAQEAPVTLRAMSAAPLGAIFGTGRSGSTWLGALANSHPQLTYRFEPFHRQRGRAPVAAARRLLEASELSHDDLAAVAAVLREPTAKLDKPPFFRKEGARPIDLTRPFVWPMAKKLDLVGKLYEGLYRPRSEGIVVFKEVDLNDLLLRLLEAGAPIVYLVRHPCAVLASMKAGQAAGVMPSARRQIVLDHLRKHGSDALRHAFEPRVESLSDLEAEALIWRIDVERVVPRVLAHPGGHLVVYDALVDDPPGTASAMFAHFGLGASLPEQTTAFIDASTRGDDSTWNRLRYGEVGIRRYFSVFRDPRASRDAWRERMGEDERARVLEIVGDSEVWTAQADAGVWRA